MVLLGEFVQIVGLRETGGQNAHVAQGNLAPPFSFEGANDHGSTAAFPPFTHRLVEVFHYLVGQAHHNLSAHVGNIPSWDSSRYSSRE
nr:hypothetical protein [Cryobacterium glaciale]